MNLPFRILVEEDVRVVSSSLTCSFLSLSLSDISSFHDRWKIVIRSYKMVDARPVQANPLICTNDTSAGTRGYSKHNI